MLLGTSCIETGKSARVGEERSHKVGEKKKRENNAGKLLSWCLLQEIVPLSFAVICYQLRSSNDIEFHTKSSHQR